MQVKIYIGDSNCTNCGKKHKKVFEIDGKPYGSSCANELLGKNLTAPVWLYELAEEWVQEDVSSDYSHIEDCSINFFNHYETVSKSYSGQKVWSKPIKLQGKNVKVDWQFEINDYIVERYKAIKGIK